MARLLVPGDYHPSHQARVERLQGSGKTLCGAQTTQGWLCIQPVVSGSDHCYKHTRGVESPMRRVDDADLRLAAEYFARGATGKQVGDMLGLSANQANRLKKLKTFPLVRKHKPELAPIDLTMVGIMKTNENQWTELYANKPG